jgi:hypothetical protein
LLLEHSIDALIFGNLPYLPIEFPGILAYAEDADEFVRLNCREHTGWRRDEWAYSPLFICGKFPGFLGHFLRFWG